MRVTINMDCSDCGRKNYTTKKNKQKTTDKLQMKKFCRFCRKHTVHKEGK